MGPLHCSLVDSIRQMLPADVPAVSELIRSTLELDYSMDTYLAMFSFWPAGAIVAERAGEVVGFLGAVIQAEGEARILVFAVHPHHRGQGIGSSLLREFLIRCSGNGVRIVTLEVRESNRAAIRFYEKNGFQPVEFIEKCYSDGEGGYRMVLWL